MKEPLVTIITISYNASEYIDRAITSVLSQSYLKIEYIIVDGGSTDGTIDIIKKYDEKISTWISEKDNGISDAFNKGIKMASGDIIGFVNADDWLEHNIVSRIVDSFSNYDLVYGKIKYWSTPTKFKVKGGNHLRLNSSWRGMCIPHPSLFVKAVVYEEIGTFNIEYRNAMDYDFVLRAYLANYKFYNSELVVSNFSKGGVTSTNMKNMLLEEREIKSRQLQKSKLMLQIEYMFKYIYLRLVK